MAISLNTCLVKYDYQVTIGITVSLGLLQHDLVLMMNVSNGKQLSHFTVIQAATM